MSQPACSSSGCRRPPARSAGVAGARALRDLLPDGRTRRSTATMLARHCASQLSGPASLPRPAAPVAVRQIDQSGACAPCNACACDARSRPRPPRHRCAGQRVAAEAPALVGQLPARRRGQPLPRSRSAQRLGAGAAIASRRPSGRPSRMKTSSSHAACGRRHRPRSPRLRRLVLDQPAQVQRVGMAPVALGAAALGAAASRPCRAAATMRRPTAPLLRLPDASSGTAGRAARSPRQRAITRCTRR